MKNSIFLGLVCCLCLGTSKNVDALEVAGVTEPIYDSTIGTEAPGKVAAIPCREGTAVKQGDIIVKFEDVIESLEVERRRNMAESKAELHAASNRVVTLAMDVGATRKLFESTRSVSREEMMKRELELTLARAELARVEADEVREGVEFMMAQAHLDRRYIRAPFDGVVTYVFPEIGENVTAQQPVARVVDTTECRFIAHVEPGRGWSLREGDAVQLLFGQVGGGDFIVDGLVHYVSPVVDPSSGLQEVRVRFHNRDGRVRPGTIGRMRQVSDS